MTASPGVYAILCSCKERLCQESTLRGLRREVSPDLLRRTEMKSKAGAQCGSAPRDPPRNGQAGRGSRRRQRTQRKKFLYSRRKVLVCKPRGTIPTLPSPLRAAKQGLGSELTSGGGQEPSLTEPQRDRCRRSRRMRCSAKRVRADKCYILLWKRFRKRNLHLITACGRSCLAAARVSSSSASGTAVLGLPRRPIHCRAPASQPSEGKPEITPAPRSDSLPFPYTAAWLSELCGVSDPPAG